MRAAVGRMRARELRWTAGLVLLGLLAFALRATVVHATKPVGYLDSVWYRWVASQIAHGDPISWQLLPVWHRAPTATHGIGFPLILGAAQRLGATTLTAQKLVGCAIGAFTVVAIGMVGTRLGGRSVGLTAAGLAALYPPLILNDSVLMSEPLYGLLCALAILAGLSLRRSPRASAAIAFGVVVGLAALTRTEGLLLLPFLGVPLLWRVRGRWRRWGIAAAAAILIISPWVVRNWHVFGRPALTTNGGSVWVGANCHETYYGDLIGAWSPRCFIAALGHGVERNELSQSDIWSRQGRDYARRHAARLPVVVGARIARTFNLYPLDPGRQAGDMKAEANATSSSGFNLLCVWAGFALLPLAGAGFRFTGREARVALLPLLGFTIVLVAASESLPPRRELADIALILIAAHGLAHAAQRLRRRPGRAPVAPPQPSTRASPGPAPVAPQ